MAQLLLFYKQKSNNEHCSCYDSISFDVQKYFQTLILVFVVSQGKVYCSYLLSASWHIKAQEQVLEAE